MPEQIKEVEFLGSVYTKESIQSLKTEALLEIRNLVAENMGLSRVKSLPEGQEVDKCWSALVQYQKSDAQSEDPKPKPESKKTEPKPKKDQRVKTDVVREPKRPTKSMFRRVRHLKPHPGKGDRIARFHLYVDGTRIIDAMIDPNMRHEDLPYYEEKGFIALDEIGDEQFEKELREWYESRGKKHPDDVAKEKEEARAAERAAKLDKAKAES